MYRPWGSHCLLLPMVSSLHCLHVCSVIVIFMCMTKKLQCFQMQILAIVKLFPFTCCLMSSGDRVPSTFIRRGCLFERALVPDHWYV